MKRYPRLDVWRDPGPGTWYVWTWYRAGDLTETQSFPTFDNALHYVRDLLDHHAHVERVRGLG